MLTTAPILAYPKIGLDAEFVLEMDASRTGLGAVVWQQQSDGMLHPIAYASHSLDPSESNYSITELKTLAVVWLLNILDPTSLDIVLLCTLTIQPVCLFSAVHAPLEN